MIAAAPSTSDAADGSIDGAGDDGGAGTVEPMGGGDIKDDAA